MEHELIPVYTKFNGNGVRVQNDSKLIDYLDDGWKIINVTAANPLALDNEAVVGSARRFAHLGSCPSMGR